MQFTTACRLRLTRVSFVGTLLRVRSCTTYAAGRRLPGERLGQSAEARQACLAAGQPPSTSLQEATATALSPTFLREERLGCSGKDRVAFSFPPFHLSFKAKVDPDGRGCCRCKCCLCKYVFCSLQPQTLKHVHLIPNRLHWNAAFKHTVEESLRKKKNGKDPLASILV